MKNISRISSSRHKINGSKNKIPIPKKFKPLEKIDFKQVEKIANVFADFIESHFEKISEILLDYESFEVVQDETNRTLDVLRNLRENKKYFDLRIGEVTTFLPKNQPLYALTCFVIVPSLMATEVHFRIPHSMRHFFPKLLRAINFKYFFPNVHISTKERQDFLKERSALYIENRTDETYPVTDVVIFTGQSHHADRLRLVFDKRTLFIANGSGHNPVVVSDDADIDDAVEATLTLQLYNQGQDCAAPNAILVHSSVYSAFLRKLRDELLKVRVGEYRDRTCRVGPISEPEDLVRIQEILINNQQWLDPSTSGVINAKEGIVHPTIICRPLKKGGNFVEVFAPLIFVQKYEDDFELSLYFEDSHYARNAMYITVYGSSEYVNNLINRPIGNKILHDKSTVIFDKHLHADGVERGTQPYGGYGYSASSLSIGGNITSKPTLPQRDIYEWIVKPLKKRSNLLSMKKLRQKAKKLFSKDIAKILGAKIVLPNETSSSTPIATEVSYIDSHAIQGGGKRYVKVDAGHFFQLLSKPNIEFIASLEPKEIDLVRKLRIFLSRSHVISLDEFNTWLYKLPTNEYITERENKERQLKFFICIYNLLLGKSSGPRIAQLLLDVDRKKLLELLQV